MADRPKDDNIRHTVTDALARDPQPDQPPAPTPAELAAADPLASLDLLRGIHPAEETSLSLPQKRKVISAVFRALDIPLDLETACYAADISPQTFGKWVRDSPSLAKAIRRRMAKLEKTLILEMRKGGKGFPKAKAALVVLERNYSRWEAKTNISISRSFEKALDHLEKQLDAETFALVVETLERHS